jgi:hypothetical protein
MSILYRVIASLLLALLLPFLFSSQTKRERLVKKMYQTKIPVEIVEVQVGNSPQDKKSIKLDSKFLADDDWLKGFSVKLKNRSGK